MYFSRNMLSIFISAFFLVPYSFIANFIPVAVASPYDDAIAYVQESGIMQGDASGFAAERTMNRAELIKIVAASKYDAAVIEKCIASYQEKNYWYVYFKDVSTDAWYAPYVCVAQQVGLIQGYPDHTLHPEQPVSFVEAAKILLRTLDIPDDTAAIPWYKPFVLELEARNAIPESISGFDAQLKRGEFAEIVYRILNNVDTKPSRKYADLVPA